MKNCLLFLVSMLMVVGGLFAPDAAAQGGRVTGKVRDAQGNSLAGVSVTVKNTLKGTNTDAEGNYALAAASNDVLVFEFIGYESAEATVGSRTVVDVTLKESVTEMDQVVVVGYGTMEKKMVTSAISSVSGGELMPGSGDASVANALRGKVGNLTISGTDSPNSGNSLQLRGMASVNAGQGPLVVIDGMPGGDIRSVLPEDIQSIDVLKDASAGAIYGSRAAGGVILITTKNANRMEDGSLQLMYTGEFAHKTVMKRPDILSAEEYLTLRADEGATDYGSDFDWYDAMLNKNNFSHKHTVNLQANGKKASIYTTFQYNDNEGIAMNDSRTDISGRMNATFHALNGWLDVTTKAGYRQAKRDNRAPDFAQAIRNNPTRSAYDPDSETGYNVWLNETLEYNTIADSNLRDYEGIDKWFMPEVSFKLNILPVQGLTFNQTLGYELRQWEEHTYTYKTSRGEIENARKGTAYLGFSKTENINAEGYGSYIRSWDKHNLNAMVGYSYYEGNGESFNMTNYDFSVEGVKYWDIGTGTYLKKGLASMGSSKNVTTKLFSYFGRVNYDYDNRYLLSASLRRESSSKFMKNNRWGTFWSVSGGWRISDEKFMENASWVSDLKIRAAYGVTGNSSFSTSYGALAYGSDGYFMMPNTGNYNIVYGPSINLNEDLKWEEQHGWNIGIDYSFFDDRLYGKFDWYNRKVVDMLYSVKVPQPPYPNTDMMKNIGSMTNRGWEFEIGADIVRSKDWSYTTNIILSHDKTKITTLYGDSTFFEDSGFPAPGSPGNAKRVEEGTTIGQFYLLKGAGIDTETGDFLVYNKDGEIIQSKNSTSADKQYTGNFVPKVIASWNHRVKFRNWDLGIDIRSWIDFDVYNTLDMYFGLTNQGGINLLKSAYGRNKDIKVEKKLCDYFLEDGTFVKIDAINLGYTLPLSGKTNSFIKSLRVYANINNLCTITGYKGMDPEVNINGIGGGIEWWNTGFYPRTRTYIFGVQLTF